MPADQWIGRLHRRATPQRPHPAAEQMAASMPVAAEPEYTDAEVTEMWALYKAHRCPFCGGAHQRECPRVKTITRYADGKPQSVTYFRTWDDSNVLWPEDIPGEPPKEQP